MKARVLRKLLNDTGYLVSNHNDYIAIGSPLCHDLISVNKETLKLRYALDTWRKGREALEEKGELLFIWDKLQELINSGEIKDIINGKDEIENPLPVFTVDGGKLIESVTDEYGWPNTDDNGVLMCENTHFKTKEEAIRYGIEESKAGIEMDTRNLQELEERMQKIKNRMEVDRKNIEHLQSL